MLMKFDLSQRLGFRLNEVGRLYGRTFDQLARQRLCLSRAQCRLLATLAMHGSGQPLSQAALAEAMDLTAMAVATLCDRMEAAGWIRRVPSKQDRRINELVLEPKAHQALEATMALGDEVQALALGGFSAAEQQQFMAFLQRAEANLGAVPAEPAAERSPRASRSRRGVPASDGTTE